VTRPVVSVVIPLYQKGDVVLGAVRSVLGQSFGDLELIVVDDGSSDEGPARVLAAADGRVRMIRQANAGPGAARNRGLTEARGSLVSFLDADDEWSPEFLQSGVQALEAAPDYAAWIAGRWEGPDRVSRTERDRRMGLTSGRWRLSPATRPRRLKYFVDFCHSSCVLARREVVEQLGGYYAADRCSYGEDSYLWLLLVLNHPLLLDLEPRVWFHTEHSVLGAARMGRHPVRPALIASEPLIARCDPAYRDALRDLLAYYRLLETEKLMQQGSLRTDTLRRWRTRYPWARRPDAKTLALELWCSLASVASALATRGSKSG
jgi:hypothetical protein